MPEMSTAKPIKDVVDALKQANSDINRVNQRCAQAAYAMTVAAAAVSLIVMTGGLAVPLVVSSSLIIPTWATGIAAAGGAASLTYGLIEWCDGIPRVQKQAKESHQAVLKFNTTPSDKTAVSSYLENRATASGVHAAISAAIFIGCAVCIVFAPLLMPTAILVASVAMASLYWSVGSMMRVSEYRQDAAKITAAGSIQMFTVNNNPYDDPEFGNHEELDADDAALGRSCIN